MSPVSSIAIMAAAVEVGEDIIFDINVRSTGYERAG